MAGPIFSAADHSNVVRQAGPIFPENLVLGPTFSADQNFRDSPTHERRDVYDLTLDIDNRLALASFVPPPTEQLLWCMKLARGVARLFPRCPETPLSLKGAELTKKCACVACTSRGLVRKRQRVEHIISCHSQEVSVAVTASTSLSAGPSSSPQPLPLALPVRRRAYVEILEPTSELSQVHDEERLWLLQNAFRPNSDYCFPPQEEYGKKRRWS